GGDEHYGKSESFAHRRTVLRPTRRDRDYRPKALIGDFDRVVFDHGVGEQFLAHGFKPGTRGRNIRSFQLQVEDLALPDPVDAGKAQSGQGAFDGLSLGIENAVLERDDDARFHQPASKSAYCTSRGPVASALSVSTRMPRRWATSR